MNNTTSIHNRTKPKNDDNVEVVNVSKIKQLSPFRYPGGKTWLVPKFLEWIVTLKNKPVVLIEPFAGGGIISLTAAYYNVVEKCIMIEKDENVASVWKTIIHGDWEYLVDRILATNLTVDNVKKILCKSSADVKETAFKTIIKNRVSHGGVMANGSGFIKNGENGRGIGSRWYPETLANRIKLIASFRNRIEFIEGDAFDYFTTYANKQEYCYFIDPPYTASKKKAGKRLYQYNHIDHENLFCTLERLKGPFMLTYDYDDIIVEYANKYSFCHTILHMKGTHNVLRRELMITN